MLLAISQKTCYNPFRKKSNYFAFGLSMIDQIIFEKYLEKILNAI